MKDSDPRPMPPTVLAAYSDPLVLSELFFTKVFTQPDRVAVKDAMLSSLIRKHGKVDLPYGRGYRSIDTLVSRFKKNPWNGIGMRLSVPEYSEDGSAKKELARAMQPYWAAWWEVASVVDRDYYDVISLVLGKNQLRWINAQLARMVVDINYQFIRDLCLDLISYVEEYAEYGGHALREQCMTLRRDLREVVESEFSGNMMDKSAFAAMASVSCLSDSSITDAVEALSIEDYGYNWDIRAERRCADLVRSLITPTLVTDPIR